jgi:hypothetical protein
MLYSPLTLAITNEIYRVPCLEVGLAVSHYQYSARFDNTNVNRRLARHLLARDEQGPLVLNSLQDLFDYRQLPHLGLRLCSGKITSLVLPRSS